MDNVLFYLVPTNELATKAAKSAFNRNLHDEGIREGLVLRIPLPGPDSLRQSPEKTDFLSFGSQPDNRVVLSSNISVPYHCHLWLRRQRGGPWILTDTSSEGTRVVDDITPGTGESIRNDTRAVVHLASLEVAGCVFEFRYPKSASGNTDIWTQHLDTSPNSSTRDNPHTGLRMPEYVIGPTLGSGGQGRVFKVLRKRTGFVYALKEITIPVEAYNTRKQQEREINYMKTLRHEGILNLLAFSVESYPKNFIVRILMPLCETSLENIIPDERIFHEFMRQGCEAMGFLHSHDIIHRDIKPQNILLLDGQPYRYVLADFGYANKTHEARSICGTPGYMAPEILIGEPYDARSDTFSMGIVGFEIRGVFKGFQDEVKELPEQWIVYQCARQVKRRTSRVNDALANGELPDKEGWYKLLAAMTQADPKARPTARQVLDCLTPQSSAHLTRGSTVCSEPPAKRRNENPKANLDSSRPTGQQPPAAKRYLACHPTSLKPGGNIPIHEDVVTAPLQNTKAACRPRFRMPVEKFRSPANGLRQPLQTNNNMARLTANPYPKNKPKIATKYGLASPANDQPSELNAPEPKSNKGNEGQCGNAAMDLAIPSSLNVTAKRTRARHGAGVPPCLKAQHSRFDRSRVAKRKAREQRKIPGAWCICKRVSCGGTCSMSKLDPGSGRISPSYPNGKRSLIQRILAFFPGQ